MKRIVSKPRLVVLTGAGISAESGLKTFRGNDGLWENHRVEEVATPEAWRSNPALVTRFYNQRRVQLGQVQPNEGHKALKKLENFADVYIITQNVDDLHERAGSSKVMHLHGLLTQVCSERNKQWVMEVGYREMEYGEKAPDGALLRPNVVWFGEAVPMLEPAAALVATADYLWIVGTSLQVYPAAGLIHHAPANCRITLVDPCPPQVSKHVQIVKGTASAQLPILVNSFGQSCSAHNV